MHSIQGQLSLGKEKEKEKTKSKKRAKEALRHDVDRSKCFTSGECQVRECIDT